MCCRLATPKSNATGPVFQLASEKGFMLLMFLISKLIEFFIKDIFNYLIIMRLSIIINE